MAAPKKTARPTGPETRRPGAARPAQRAAGKPLFAVSGNHRAGLDEAVRHGRVIAADIAADGFGLLVSIPTGEHALQSVFDCDFPLASPYLAAFLAVHDGEAARYALASSAPLHWGGTGEAPGASPWPVRLASHGGVVPGIAFPCYPERGPHGLVLFWGRRLALGSGALAAIHARCFALFEAVSLIRAEGEARHPQLSKRELECLELTAEGRTSEEIAAILKLSVHTTNQHLAYAAQKLNAVNRIHAVAKALRLGLIE